MPSRQVRARGKVGNTSQEQVGFGCLKHRIECFSNDFRMECPVRMEQVRFPNGAQPSFHILHASMVLRKHLRCLRIGKMQHEGQNLLADKFGFSTWPVEDSYDGLAVVYHIAMKFQQFSFLYEDTTTELLVQQHYHPRFLAIENWPHPSIVENKYSNHCCDTSMRPPNSYSGRLFDVGFIDCNSIG